MTVNPSRSGQGSPGTSGPDDRWPLLIAKGHALSAADVLVGYQLGLERLPPLGTLAKGTEPLRVSMKSSIETGVDGLGREGFAAIISVVFARLVHEGRLDLVALLAEVTDDLDVDFSENSFLVVKQAAQSVGRAVRVSTALQYADQAHTALCKLLPPSDSEVIKDPILENICTAMLQGDYAQGFKALSVGSEEQLPPEKKHLYMQTLARFISSDMELELEVARRKIQRMSPITLASAQALFRALGQASKASELQRYHASLQAETTD